MNPLYAVENGSDALGNAVVVPIITEAGYGKNTNCSGALILQSVVITAGHCLLDENGSAASNIYVGPPGSSFTFDSKTWAKALSSYFTVDYQGSGLNNTVGAGDIGVITLNKNFQVANNLTLASENQLLSIKNTNSKLRLIGYGYVTDSGQLSSSPNYFDANYTSLIPTDPNQSLAESSFGNACSGDSGGPVLYITPTRTLLIGVITGAYFSNKCSKRQTNGKYLTAFTIVNRYANVAMAGASQALTTEIAIETEALNNLLKSQSESQQTKKDYLKLQDDLLQLQANYENLQKSSSDIIKDLQLQIATLKKMLPSTIVCVKGKISKSITATTPKCPSGYAQK